MLRVDASDDAPRWAAEHRDALRTLVAEHGSLLVRGLGLRDVAQTDAVFRRLGSLMDEKEAFAPRRRYAQGVYSSSKWPPNQPMCMRFIVARGALRDPLGRYVQFRPPKKGSPI